jgi:hypothetical protein
MPGGLGRGASLALAVGASVVFAALWIGLAWAVAVDPSMPAAAWSWLRALELVPQLVAWIAVLPVAVALWVWTASFPPFVGILVGLGLVAWTAAAAGGLLRQLRAR